MSARRTVVLAEISQIAHSFPLASAYLHNYAVRHAASAGDYRLTIRPFHVDVPVRDVIDRLVAEEAEVYTFSCYCWNMKRVREILAALRRARPRASFLLGGAQVLDSAERTMGADAHNLFVCNGEGERTFQAFLDAHGAARPDYSTVPGLSYFRDGAWLTTAPAAQVELDSIPSPFLSSPFSDETRFTNYLWETNRGCPFHCTFCLWGQLQDSVARFDLARLKEEITYMARRQYVSLHICDANWGMLERDLELAEHIAREKRERGVPFIVKASHIKNQPERVVAMAQVLAKEGIRGCTTTALQSFNDATLITIKRRNTSREKLEGFEDSLAARGLGSYAEVIWPLPEETLVTFTDGLERLARIRMGSALCYPLMLLNHTEMSERREEHGFVTVWDSSEVKEIEWVVATRQVSEAEYREGLWLYLAFHLLYNARSLYYTMHYLFERHGVGYQQILARFAERLRADESPIGMLCRRVVLDWDPSLDGATYGVLLGYALHSHRREQARLVEEFCAAEQWWSIPEARALAGLDRLARPLPYRNQPLDEESGAEIRGRAYVVELAAPVREWLRRNLEVGELEESGVAAVIVDHDRDQLPHMAKKPLTQQAYYLQTLLDDMRSVVPRIRERQR